MLEPEIQSAHDVSGSGDPGKKWYFRCNCGSTQFIGQARRYDEFGTCRHRSAELGSIRHCPRTDDRAVHLCHFCNCFQGGIRPQGDRLHLWKTKTDSPRTIPMSEATTELATELASGGIPTANMLRRHWEKARMELGLRDDDLFVFHTTRHTCATRLVDAGVYPFVIQEWLGHKSIETTLRYAHVRPENLDAALAKADLFRTAANCNAQSSAGSEGGPPLSIGVPKRPISAKR